MIEQRYKLDPIPLSQIRSTFSEAYLEFYGIDHLRPSYTAWIYFSKRLPKKVTPRSRGYAGTLAVFGHSQCWGSEGHCCNSELIRRFDSRPSRPMTRAFKRVPVAHRLKKHLEAGNDFLEVCIYAYTREPWPEREGRSLLCCRGVQLVTM